MKKNIAIVGAAGLVGKTLLKVLAQRNFPIEQLFLFGSDRSTGQILTFGGREYAVLPLADFNWQAQKIDIAFFSAGNKVSLQYAPAACDSGCIVIDNSSAFRYADNVPLLVPEVNERALEMLNYLGAPNQGAIIANPNCSTIQMVMALAPIHKIATLKRVIVSTYQAVSGAGQALIDELQTQPESLIQNNLIPQIDVMQDNGYSREEMKMLWETRKILNLPHLLVSATAVRVPVVNAHSEAITIETEKKISVKQAIACLKKMPGVVVLEEHWVTPKEISGRDEVFISRIRQDLAFGEYGLSFWIVADNLRKGAALNAVQIAEKFQS